MPYADPEQRRAFQREYMRERRKTKAQKEYDAAYGKKYRADNWEAVKERQYQWREDNPDGWKRIRRRNNHARRAGGKREYAGIQLINTLIEVIYDTRDILTEITGKVHHVDHITPLSKGGKHVPWNLQVLTASENLRKGSLCES